MTLVNSRVSLENVRFAESGRVNCIESFIFFSMIDIVSMIIIVIFLSNSRIVVPNENLLIKNYLQSFVERYYVNFSISSKLTILYAKANYSNHISKRKLLITIPLDLFTFFEGVSKIISNTIQKQILETSFRDCFRTTTTRQRDVATMPLSGD